ncbi:CpaF family protein [Microbacterium sp. ZXX196]|nr:CpaF family protein [Microbacterium sp. ZXX196]
MTDRVRQRVREDRAALGRAEALPADVARIAAAEVRRHNDRALAAGGRAVEDGEAAVREIVAAVSGYGPLQPLLDDDEIEEIWINRPDAVYVARAGVASRTSLVLTRDQVRDVVERMLHQAGRRIDISEPFVDASLPDGSRLHVVLAGIARGAWAVNIRKFLPGAASLDRLVELGSMPEAVARELADAMRAGRSVLVSGATHAGKTTLLGALASAAGAQQRLVTVEETFELAIDAPDIVALQGRQPSLEGTGEITLRRLVKEALRMRPDRLVIGEVRDAEALDLVLALNTGIPGAATIHANSAADALAKLAALPLLAGRNIDRGFIVPAVASGVDLVVHCARGADGSRWVEEVVATTGTVEDGVPLVRQVYRASHPDLAAGEPARAGTRAGRRGERAA